MSGHVIRSVSFPKEVFEGLNKMAKELHRPRSRVLVEAIMRYYRTWLLGREQEKGRKYAKKLGIKSETDVYRAIGL